MHEVEVFAGLLVAVVAVALLARRVEPMPHSVALVLGGTVVGVLPFVPEVHLDPDVVFMVFLPPILYPSAAQFAAEDLRGALRAITWLAIGLVLATVGAIAVAVHAVSDLPWAACFALGAVLAPTDPVSATAVIRSSGAPARLATILEGESLINDGTALTVLRVAIASVGTAFAIAPAAGEFVLVAGGGAGVGAALGWGVAMLRRRLDDVELESTIDVLVAFGAFLLAERIGVSGVLATVAAGFVVGSSDDVASGETRMRESSFWRITQFLAESMLFLLVGIVFGQVVGDPATRSIEHLVGLTAIVVVTAVGVRMAWMFTVPHLAAALDLRQRGARPSIGAAERIIVGLAGLRGAVSVAAALSIPLAVEGEPFPQRGTVVAVALAAIVVLLVLPALALPVALRAVGLAGAGDAEDRERHARAQLADAALAQADALAQERDYPDPVMLRVRERYLLRLERYADEGHEEAPDDHEERLGAYHELWHATLEAQRKRLADMRGSGEVSGETLRRLERELDLEEARIR